MLSRFFIDRPIFAWVIAIGIAIAGILTIPRLPIAQYPAVAPPTVSITANYPGASGEVVEQAVTQIIEQQLAALDGFLYMQANSNSNGQSQINVSFEPGTNPDTAQVQVQNRVSQALPRLPQQVQQQGLTVRKAGVSNALMVALYDTSGKLTAGDLSDFLSSNLQDPISRISGIGDMQVFGGQFAMRIWLDPFKLRSFGLTPSDVQTAILAQNAQISAGQLGAQPAVEGQRINAIVNVQSRFRTPQQFREILLRANPDGSAVRLADVARVELGSENYNFVARYNGYPSAAVVIRLTPDANAIETLDAIKALVQRMSPSFPPNVRATFPIDAAPFVERAIHDVVTTLIEGIVLVVVVMFLFLQSWRATLIPAIAVPVVLLGTFAIFGIAGFSINMLTMFGMVLAIGLLVDDAIVVIENVERLMHDENLSPRAATRKSMDEITSALVGIAVVLSAVFLPMAFFGGATGIIYRQFSVTIVSAMVLSLLVALVVTPALCATILKPHPPGSVVKTSGAFGWFNRGFDSGLRRYQTRIARMIPRRKLWFLVYGGICVAMVVMFMRTPTSFLPDEDQGRMNVQFVLPEGSTLEQTQGVAARISRYVSDNEKSAVAGLFVLPGFSVSGSGQNLGQGFFAMRDWDERKGRTNSVASVAERASKYFAGDRQARVFAIVPSAVPELGNASGFDLQLQNVSGMSHEDFLRQRDRFMDLARQDPALSGVRFNGVEDQPQLQVSIDRAKAGALGISQQDVNALLSTALGGTYVNDFLDGERVKRVYVQADAPFRMRAEDIGLWALRTSSGSMAPFASIAQTSWTYGPVSLTRYNGVPSFSIQGVATPGSSTGTALDHVEKIIRGMNSGVDFAWTGLSYQESLSSGQSLPLYAISLLVVFLALAALYESWSIPVSVLLVVPLGIIGAVLAANLRGMENGIFFQVGLLTTMGLAAKNAILIVEFASKIEAGGSTPYDAVMLASRLRLRPILMTSLAFMAGVFPLMIASGAGAGSQNAIGTAVIGGMITGAVLAVFFVPVFYVAVRAWVAPARPDATVR
jgi:hydrophobe/amphiphile efflux-1 (HAE1) family protein